MNGLYIFTKGKYLAYFFTDIGASELKLSVAINNGFDEDEVTVWDSVENVTPDDIFSGLDEKEVLEVSEGLFEVVNAPEKNMEIVSDYNDQDTREDNMAPPYTRTLLGHTLWLS
jgi:hypothetical protein